MLHVLPILSSLIFITSVIFDDKLVMKLLSVQFPVPARYVLPLRTKYLPQHPVIGHPHCYSNNKKRTQSSVAEGDVCRLGGGRRGICKPLSQCQPAYQRLRQARIKPIHCGFKGFEEIVCCDDEVSQRLRKSELGK